MNPGVSPRRFKLVVACFGALALLGASGSIGYVRATVDLTKNPDPHCLWWAASVITLHQSTEGAPDTPTAPGAITKAWETWQKQLAACGNSSYQEGPALDSHVIGYDDSAGATNSNLIVFRPSTCSKVVPANDSCITSDTCNNTYNCWNYDESVIALTTNTYDLSTGQIDDSDIEFNAGSFYFTTVNTPVCPTGTKSQSCIVYDVQNTATHELGHVLGLAHSPNPVSTMYADAPSGQLSKRTLDSGSLQFVCDVYPKGAPSKDCIIDESDGALGKAVGCSVTGEAGSLFATVFVGAWMLLRRGSA